MKKRATRNSMTMTCTESTLHDSQDLNQYTHVEDTLHRTEKNDLTLPLKVLVSEPPDTLAHARKRPRTTEEEGNGRSPSKRVSTPPLLDTAIERARNVDTVVYGLYDIGAWYYSPYPSEFGPNIDKLYICEHCLRYTNEENQLRVHKLNCKKRKLPGRVMYQQGNIKIYEIDGREQKLFCQNLCLMAKLFVDHKTLYYDTEGFKFYVLTEQIKRSDIMVGYFSKEKLSYDNYNLACIMVLPTHQRKGYGRLLIEMSYALSKKEGVVGSPEKPLSTLGALGYRAYWASTLISFMRTFRGDISICDISKETCIHEEDIVSTLSRLGLLVYSKPLTISLPPISEPEQQQQQQQKEQHQQQKEQHQQKEQKKEQEKEQEKEVVHVTVESLNIYITESMLDKAVETYRISLTPRLLPECILF